MARFVFSLLSTMVVFSTAALAQELPKPPGPEKEHQWLEQFVGEWSTESKAEMGPGQPPLECTGTIHSRRIGGLWVLNEMKGEVAGTSMVGIQTIGYDPGKKRYVGTWVDSMVNYLWQYEGTVDETGKVLTLDAEGPNFMADGKLAKFRDIYAFKSADEMAISSQMLGKDGKWVTFMSGTAKRAKPQR
jgi:hypothetical protein